jgi:acetyl-CoA carboxylase carboxyl transferase subunit beta
MSWFSRSKAPKPENDESDKVQIPDDIWTKCPECGAVLYTKELRRSFGVCTKCEYHFRLKSTERIPLLVDRHSFVELNSNLRSPDPLNFKDSKKYKERLKKAEKTAPAPEAVVTGRARILNVPVMLGVFESSLQ